MSFNCFSLEQRGRRTVRTSQVFGEAWQNSCAPNPTQKRYCAPFIISLAEGRPPNSTSFDLPSCSAKPGTGNRAGFRILAGYLGSTDECEVRNQMERAAFRIGRGLPPPSGRNIFTPCRLTWSAERITGCTASACRWLTCRTATAVLK